MRKPPQTGPILDGDADAFSIREFCRRHGISESFYFKLKEQNCGPREMRIGSRVLISREAAKRWRTRHTSKRSGSAA
jgi:hypothetical protein